MFKFKNLIYFLKKYQLYILFNKLKVMLNRCLNRGEKLIPKIMPSFKHTSFIVYKNKIVAEGVNKYHGEANAHAEEEAMRKVSTKGARSSKRGEKGYRSLQGPRSICIQV